MRRRQGYKPKPISTYTVITAGATVGWLVFLGVGLFIAGLIMMTIWLVLLGAGLVWLALGIFTWVCERVAEDE